MFLVITGNFDEEDLLEAIKKNQSEKECRKGNFRNRSPFGRAESRMRKTRNRLSNSFRT